MYPSLRVWVKTLLIVVQIGLQCKNDHIYICLDAKVMLGPIELGLIGFGVGLPLRKLEKIKDLTLRDFDVVLRGAAVSFSGTRNLGRKDEDSCWLIAR